MTTAALWAARVEDDVADLARPVGCSQHELAVLGDRRTDAIGEVQEHEVPRGSGGQQADLGKHAHAGCINVHGSLEAVLEHLTKGHVLPTHRAGELDDPVR